MNLSRPTVSESLAVPSGLQAGPRHKRELASEIKSIWKKGQTPDARAALSRYPELGRDKSIILDLAYEEYCLRLEAGESPEPDEFCKRFPKFQASLRRLIEAHRFLEDNSHLLSESQSLRWPVPGEDFLGFSLREELGRGAFARVFLACEPALGHRQVAIKVSLQGASEAETLGRINHPNIVPVHSVHEDKHSGLTVVCMPYLGNATLCDVLDKTAGGASMPAKASAILEAVKQTVCDEKPGADPGQPDPVLVQSDYIGGVTHLAAQIADALACIHGMGICHRDLKPSNVLISPDGRPMLLDFNLSFDENVADSRLGGTLPYMSPEQLLATDLDSGAGPSLIDARSDIFSLGILLYELLAGAHPFDPLPLKLSSPELRRYLLQRQRDGVHSVRERNPRVDRRLAELVQRCLEYNPNDRPQTANELAAALRKLSPLRRLRRWVTGHKGATLATATALLIAISTAAYGLAQLQPAPQSELERGFEAYRRGMYVEAIEALSSAIDRGARPSRAYYIRGRAHQKLGNGDPALVNFEEASRQETDGRALASIAYCLSGRKMHAVAKGFNLQAMAQGFATAEVHNNLGYCYERLNQFDKAETEFNQAIALNPKLQAAYYNRGMVDLKRHFLNPAYAPAAAVQDFDQALRLNPTADLSYMAGLACVCVAQALDTTRLQLAFPQPLALAKGSDLFALLSSESLNEGQAWLEHGFAFLEQAVDLGCDPRQIKSEFKLRAYQTNPLIAGLVARPTPSQTPCPTFPVADPIRD
jgi:tetratricopeptide (TPR) repeat protein